VKRSLLFLVLIIFLAGCDKAPSPKKTPAPARVKSPATELNVWGLNKLRTSGLEQSLLADFAKKHNCQINLRMFANIATLLDSLKAEQDNGMIDLVLNLDNSFTSDEEVRALFSPIEDLSTLQLSRDLIPDPQKRLIPYGYANLGVVYNTRLFPNGPESFGELQDAKYFRQLGICDPQTSGEGRGALFWSLALFGDRGYEFLWKSIRKNVKTVYPDYQQGMEALKKGSISLLLGYNTTPAWLEESQQTDKSFQFGMLKEGSWQYTESAAIPLGAAHPAMATAFIKYLIEPEAQLMVIYKLGLFPANSKTMLPIRFARIPISSFTVNRRLTETEIKESIPVWLEFWDQLFNNRYPAYD